MRLQTTPATAVATTSSAAGTIAGTRPAYWPDAVAYQEAVQNGRATLADPELAAAVVLQNRRGLPLVYSGRSAVVFRLRTASGHDWALRCFTHAAAAGQADERRARYERIAARLATLPAHFVPFRYLEQGIRVGGEWFPVVALRWAAGDTLGRFIDENLHHRPATLLDLAGALGDLRETLERAGVSHGDWQHDNLLVSNDGRCVTLVDYDNVWVPELAGWPSPELGHANYQHPRRTANDGGPGLDRFAHLVIHTGLIALARDSSLWSRFGDGESVLFKRADFERPGDTPVWAAVRGCAEAARDDVLRESLHRLEAACRASGPQAVFLPGESLVAPPVPRRLRDEARRTENVTRTILAQPPATATGRAALLLANTTTDSTRTESLAPGVFTSRLRARDMRLLDWQHRIITWLAVWGYIALMWVGSDGGGSVSLSQFVFALAVGLPPLFIASHQFWPRRKLRTRLEQTIAHHQDAARTCDDRMDAKRQRLREIDDTPYLNNLGLFLQTELAAVPIRKAAKLPHIGPATLRELNGAGIRTAADLARLFSTQAAIPDERKRILNHWYGDLEAEATDRYRALLSERRRLEVELRALRPEKDAHLLKREEFLHDQETFPAANFGAFVAALFGAE